MMRVTSLAPEWEARLAKAGPVPEELAGAPPRADVWGDRGYLSQPRYQRAFKPLLLTGLVAPAVVFEFESVRDEEGPDVHAKYAWRDAEGNLRAAEVRESYDAMHAALGSGEGELIVSADAGLKLGAVVTVIYDPLSDRHVIYEALQAAPPATT